MSSRIAITITLILALTGIATAKESPYLITYGRLDSAQRIELAKRRAQEARASGDPDGEARYLTLGCWSTAAISMDPDLRGELCDRARSAIKARDLRDGEAQLLMIEGSLAAWRLDIPRAVDRLQRAIALGAKLDLATPEATPVLRAHFALGAILLEGGRYDQALAEIGFARDRARAVGNLELVAWTDVWSCRAHNLLGDRERAAKHCSLAEAYLARDPDVFIEMNLRWMQAEADYSAGRFEDALRRYREGYALSQTRGGELLRATMRTNIATSLIALGRVDEAIPWLDALERDATAGTIPATYAPQIAEQRGEAAIRRNDLTTASRELERAAASQMHWVSIRALGRLAAVRTKNADIAGARVAHEEAIRRIETERTAVDGALQRALFMAIHAAPYRELAVMTASDPPRALELAEAGRARALLDALSSAHVAGAAAKPPSATAIRSQLARDEILVEYVSGEHELLALVATRDRVVAVKLPAAGTANQLAARVGFLRQLVSRANDESEIRAAADSLFADVLAPALAVAPEATTIVVSPDGPLHDLAFEALPSSALADRLAFARVPSAAVLATSEPTAIPRATALVAAPPDSGGLGDLPGARDEVAFLSGLLAGEVTVLTGADANIDRVRAGLDRYAVLHFAGHAVIDPVMPLRSALLLAASDHDDGRWGAADIYTRTIDADLVVLSACGTARGASAGGEGVTSLARAFMYAGARATISTLWDVDDRGAASFVTALYPRLAAGQSVGAAVAGARRELRRNGAPPRVWAAYVLSGAPGRRTRISASAPAEPKSIPYVPIALAGVGATAAALLLWRLSRRARRGTS